MERRSWLPLTRFGLVWLVLPNLPFAALSFAFCPTRAPAILLYAIIGLLWGTLGPVVAGTLFILFYMFDILTTLSSLFGLPLIEIIESVPILGRLDLAAHAPYLALIGIAAAGMAGQLAAARRLHRMQARPHVAAVLAVATLFGAGDLAVNGDATYGLKVAGLWSAYADPAILVGGEDAGSSAVARAGLDRPTGRTLLLVVVEAMGEFRDPQLRRALLEPLSDPALTARYDVTSGTVPFFGSTTAAEMRELCGRQDSYLNYRQTLPEGVSCLPNRLAAAGYRTLSLHAFSGRMFDRDEWYPVIGFQRSVFLEDIADGTTCGAVFKGYCDDRLSRLVQDEIKKQSADGPALIYWLTLDSHYPVPTSMRPAEGCDPRLGDQSCAMLRIWRRTLDEVRRMALDPGMPPMDVVVVGDHAPPLFSRKERALFDRTEVPWVSLKARGTRVTAAPYPPSAP